MTDDSFLVLSEDEKQACDLGVTAEELAQALSKFNPNPAPGTDGLTLAFYEQFWEKKLTKAFFNCTQEVVSEGKLTYTMGKGIIILIHKSKDLDRDNLSNYRPVTLTDTNYKILTKATAIRLQKVIKTIINEDQAGFVKGRNITLHLRLIDDIKNNLNVTNSSGALIALDFAKAFDTLRKECIIEALQILNFGVNFIKLIATVMQNTDSCVHNGGWLQTGSQQNVVYAKVVH